MAGRACADAVTSASQIKLVAIAVRCMTVLLVPTLGRLRAKSPGGLLLPVSYGGQPKVETPSPTTHPGPQSKAVWLRVC